MSKHIPEHLCEKLVAKGFKEIDVGNIMLDLETETITRTITLDGRHAVDIVFPTSEIDWDIIETYLT